MLKSLVISAFIAVAATLTGCGTPSLNTLHGSAADAVKDDRIVGDWVKKGQERDGTGKDVMHVTAATEKDDKDAAGGYLVTIPVDKGETVTFVVHLVKLNDVLFVNAAGGSETGAQASARTMALAVPVNQIGRLTISGEELALGFLDDAALKEHLKKNPKALTHAKTAKGDVLLTGSSKELQDFLKANAKNEGLFSKAEAYVHPPKK